MSVVGDNLTVICLKILSKKRTLLQIYLNLVSVTAPKVHFMTTQLGYGN